MKKKTILTKTHFLSKKKKTIIITTTNNNNNSKIDARRDDEQGHSLYDLSAFNTDGFDVNGYNMYIHDSEVWNQDDCFCVKGNSANITFERIKARFVVFLFCFVLYLNENNLKIMKKKKNLINSSNLLPPKKKQWPRPHHRFNRRPQYSQKCDIP